MKSNIRNSKPGSRFLKKTRKKILWLLKKSPKKFEDEDYHKLRVEIKKLKSVAGFIEFSNKHFSRRQQLKPFSKVYKQAGKIRELQLEEAFLKKNNVQFIQHYLDDMAKRIKKEKKKFGSLISKKTREKTKNVMREIEPILAKTDDNDVIQFMNNERSQIASLIQNLPLNPENAHKLRKILKEDFYTRKRIDWPSQKLKAEDHLLELLGKWHDCVVLNGQIGTSILKADNQTHRISGITKNKCFRLFTI